MNSKRQSTSDILETAIRAALDAGNYLKSRYQTELVVKEKTSLSDVVTDVDPHCEKLIRGRIKSMFPEHDFLGEEAVAPGKDASIEATGHILEADAVWIVDPLDGTTNFVHAIPLSVVSIAFASQGRIETGVIFDPYRDEVFFAQRGAGAYAAFADEVQDWLQHPADKLPGSQIHSSKVSTLDRAVMATGLPIRHAHRDQVMMRTTELINQVKSLRNLGAAALHLAYVGAGRVDGFWEYELNVWDVAAGVLIVNEAGGFVAALDGDSYDLSTRNIVACGRGDLAMIVCNILLNDDVK